MKRVVAPLVALLFACSGGSAGKPFFERFPQETTPGPDKYPVVGGVVLLDRGTLTFGVDPERGVPLVKLRRYRREKVLRPEVWKEKKIAIPFDPGSAIADLAVQTVDPEGRTQPIDEIAEITVDDGRRAKAFKLPEIAAGLVIEYTYDHYFKDPRFLPPWIFQSELPTMRSEFAVVVPPGFEVDLRYYEGGQPGSRTPERFEVSEGTRLSWSLAELPALFPEVDRPDPARISPMVHVLFVGANAGGRAFAGFRSWDDVRRWFIEERVGNWGDLAQDQAAEAIRVAGDAPLEERALKLFEIVARDLPWQPGPRVPLWRADAPSARNVLLAKQGNQTSRGMLLVALCRAAGIDALPAFYAYRDRGFLQPDFPVVRSIDGVAAVIMRPGGPLVLDPSDLTASVDVPSGRIQGTRIIVLRADQAEVALVPISNPADSRTQITYDLKVDPSGSAFGTAEVRLTGAEAGTLRALLLPQEPAKYPELIAQFVAARGVVARFDAANIADLAALRRPLVVKSAITIPQLLGDQGDAASLSLSRLVGAAGPATAQRRRYPLLVGPPRQSELAITLLLPDDHKPEAPPPPVEQKWAVGRHQITARLETQHRIGIRAIAETTGLEVSVDEYPAYLRAREGIERSLKAEIRIARPPPKRYEY
jgi:hypothetical protein